MLLSLIVVFEYKNLIVLCYLFKEEMTDLKSRDLLLKKKQLLGFFCIKN